MMVTVRTLLLYMMIAAVVLPGGRAAADTGPEASAAGVDWNRLSGRPVSRLDIEVAGPPGDTTGWIEMASTLINLPPGASFSPALLDRSLEHLKACGRFAGARAEATPEGEAVALRFHLSVSRVIRDIDIHIKGWSGLFTQDVLRSLSVYPGKNFSPVEMEAQKDIIAELFKTRGFSSPAIDIFAREDRDDNTVVLKIDITPGPWRRVRSIHISGNRAFSDTRLKSRMKTWRASLLHLGRARFNQHDLDRDMETLTEFYRKKGFAEVAITYALNTDDRQSRVAIVVLVDEGPRYEIAFSGNNRFSGRALKKEAAVYSRGNRGGMGIRKSVKDMKARYWNAGYLNADVRVEEGARAEESGAPKQVRFVIEEGPGTVVRSLTIRGNARIPTRAIERRIRSRPPWWKKTWVYVPQKLEEDIRAIEQLYRKRGYAHARVEQAVTFNEAGTEADITISIDEGDTVRVSSVRFEGLAAVTEDRALKALRLKPDELFDEKSAQKDKADLATLISEQGRPHVRVDSSIVMDENRRTAAIVYQVDEGPAVSMGAIYVSGNLRTRESVVKQEMKMTEREPFSLTRMAESQRNLRDLDIFRAVNFTPVGLAEKDDRVDLFIETVEKNPFFIELAGGYTSDQGAFGKVSAGDHNLLGTNRDGYAAWELRETGYRGDAGIRSPRFFSTRLSSVLNLSTEKREDFNQNFGVRTQGVSFGVDREWSEDLSTGINMNAEQRDSYPLSLIEEDENETYEKRSALAVTPGVLYDSRDNKMMPTRGAMVSGNVTFSRGISTSPDDFIKYRGDLRCYRPLFQTVTLALTGRAGYIDPQSGSADVSDDQLFFLGGISSVRGFNENELVVDDRNDPVGGRLSLSGTVEARMAAGKKLSLVLFYDIGKLSRLAEPAYTDTRSSVGVGLGYRTPVGPLSIYYGSKLDRKEGESPGRFHFSIGYTF
ncbi:MAG: outer membrane protein assembly factor BamA [Thermodesulfobacteriota bacterium]